MEDELEISEQIKGLYKNFDFDPIRAKDFGMYVEDDDENSDSENPKTEQEDKAIILK